MGGETGARIVEFARGRRRTRVGSGECFDLAVAALQDASQKTASDFGEVTANADYVWGSEVPLASVQPGDILQYRDYSIVKSKSLDTSYSFPDGSSLDVSESSEETISRPHHTAIAAAAPVNGALRVLEQNVERAAGRGLEKLVDDGEIFLSSTTRSIPARTESVRIDAAWGTRVKRAVGARNAAAIDAIVRKQNGKTASAASSGTETITVRGTLVAYRPQPK